MKLLVFFFLSTTPLVVNAQKSRPSVSVDGFHTVMFLPGEVFVYFTVEDESRLQGDGYIVVKTFDQCLAELKTFLQAKDSSYKLTSVKRDELQGENGGVSKIFRLVVRDHETASSVKAETYNLDGVRVVQPVSHFTISKDSLWTGLMEMAIKDAQEKASKLARMVDMKLSRVVEIQDYRFDDILGDIEETSDEMITVSCTIRVKFEIKNQ